MERTPVTSSNISSIGYDEEAKTLEIAFLDKGSGGDGAVYQYYEVPKNVYDEIMEAESKGKYLHQNIKDVFRYSKVG